MQKQALSPAERDERDFLNSATGICPVFAQFYKKLSPDMKELLQRGATAYFDTSTSEPEWRSSPDVASGLGQAMSEEVRKSGTPFEGKLDPSGGWNIAVYFEGTKESISLWGGCNQYALQKDGSSLQIFGGGDAIALTGTPRPVLAKPALARQPDDGTLSRQVSFAAKELASEANLYDYVDTDPLVQVSRDDILSLLHRRLGLQVISDSFTGWSPFRPAEPRTVVDLLTHIGDRMEPRVNPEWGWDGHYLYVRERFPYEMDPAEVPNRVLRRLRISLMESHCLDLDGAADWLHWMQESEALTWHSDRLVQARGVDYRDKLTAMVGWNSAALTFYGRLASGQRSAILADGLRTIDLSPSQLDALSGCFKAPSKSNGMERRVGLYNRDGLRVDRAQPEAGGVWPALVRIEKRGSDRYLLYVGPTLGKAQKQMKRFTAPTAQAAWQRCMTSYPGILKGPNFFGNDANYVMVLVFPDGTAQEIAMPLYERVQFERQAMVN